MSRMLEALKVLEGLRQVVSQPEPEVEPEPVAQCLVPAMGPSPNPAEAFEICSLPTTSALGDCYLELARRISEQLASNYCNVLLFVCPNDAAETCFSMTYLAQAFAMQSAGNVLLVDGDLRRGRLSKAVCPRGAGMIEVMLGTAAWPEIIHSTTTPRIDFVARGNGRVPTLGPTELGWGALRSKYRAVLIGVAVAEESQTRPLAARCDGVYFLVSQPRVKRRRASEIVSALRACGANVLGCVVTHD